MNRRVLTDRWQQNRIFTSHFFRTCSCDTGRELSRFNLRALYQSVRRNCI